MDWTRQLERSVSEASIVELARKYVDRAPQWLHCFIPRDCRRRALHSAGDVLHWSATLARRFAGEPIAQHDPKVQELVVFFVKAASRLTDLRDRDLYAANFERYEAQGRSMDIAEQA